MTKGEINLEEAFTLNFLSRNATFEIPYGTEADASFSFFIEGRILGNPNYASVTHEIQVNVITSSEILEPEDDQEPIIEEDNPNDEESFAPWEQDFEENEKDKN